MFSGGNLRVLNLECYREYLRWIDGTNHNSPILRWRESPDAVSDELASAFEETVSP